MIAEKCFGQEWINAKAEELRYPDKNVIERVVRAFGLLDMLSRSACPFVFKGGTSLMLLLKDTGSRLSTDIDIICPPDANIEDYLQEYEINGFVRYELVERRQDGTNIPKCHSKLFYQVAFPRTGREDMYILLDVLYDEHQYIETKELEVLNPLIEIVEEVPARVVVPSVNDILGDKLTAFAPDSTGIPYYKKGEERSLEVIKQLYDVGRLFEHIEDMHITAEVFRRMVPIELSYRGLTMSIEEVIEGIRKTDMNIALRGALNAEQFSFLQRGIMKIRNFMYSGRHYRIDEAITDAARDAYMVTLIECGIDQIKKYSGDPMSIASLSIENLEMNKLNKLKKNFPEAFWYWYQIAELKHSN